MTETPEYEIQYRRPKAGRMSRGPWVVYKNDREHMRFDSEAAAQAWVDRITTTVQKDINLPAAETAVAEERVETPQAPTTPMATERQVDYITKLLVRRSTESGFSGLVSGLMTGQHVNKAAVRALTRARASEVIDSLTDSY